MDESRLNLVQDLLQQLGPCCIAQMSIEHGNPRENVLIIYSLAYCGMLGPLLNTNTRHS